MQPIRSGQTGKCPCTHRDYSRAISRSIRAKREVFILRKDKGLGFQPSLEVEASPTDPAKALDPKTRGEILDGVEMIVAYVYKLGTTIEFPIQSRPTRNNKKRDGTCLLVWATLGV